MKTKRVLVVGGGSAGWTAAAYLNAALNPSAQTGSSPLRGAQDGQGVEVGLVESPDVPRIGVGEATVPNINRTLAMIGIDELEFMKNVNATFKPSIRFVNWLDDKRRFYHHPFSRFSAGLRDDADGRGSDSRRFHQKTLVKIPNTAVSIAFRPTCDGAKGWWQCGTERATSAAFETDGRSAIFLQRTTAVFQLSQVTRGAIHLVVIPSLPAAGVG